MKKLDLTKKIFKNFSVAETKVAEGAPRTLVVKITSSNPDRSNDVVDPKGMDSEHFMANPIVLFAHQYDELPVAKCTNLKVLDDGVLATVEFLPEGKYAKSDIIYYMYKNGFLNAWSVGFMPKGDDAYMENDLGGYDFKQWELLEFSSVPVPANAEALTVMRSKGFNVDALFKKEEKTDETKIKLIEANKTIENLTQENKDLKKQLEEKKQKISTTSVLAGLVNSLRNDLKKTDKDVGLALRTLKMFDCEKGGEKI